MVYSMPIQLLKAAPAVFGQPRRLELYEAEEIKDQAEEAREKYVWQSCLSLRRR